jgi:hypothetical protein
VTPGWAHACRRRFGRHTGPPLLAPTNQPVHPLKQEACHLSHHGPLPLRRPGRYSGRRQGEAAARMRPSAVTQARGARKAAPRILPCRPRPCPPFPDLFALALQLRAAAALACVHSRCASPAAGGPSARGTSLAPSLRAPHAPLACGTYACRRPPSSTFAAAQHAWHAIPSPCLPIHLK